MSYLALNYDENDKKRQAIWFGVFYLYDIVANLIIHAILTIHTIERLSYR